jgi:hypothetical protein
MQLVRDYVVAQLIIDMRNILTCPPTSRQVVGLYSYCNSADP